MKQFTSLLIDFEEKFKHLMEELEFLKMRAYALEDENEKLRKEIMDVYQYYLKETGDSKPEQETKQGQGFENLIRLYNEGFHVCNVHFGQIQSNEDCLFCMGFLNKKIAGAFLMSSK